MKEKKTPQHNVKQLANFDEEWAILARKTVQVLMVRRDISNYNDLSEKLKAIGVHESPRNLNAKIQRGNFSAKLFLQIIKALELKNINIDWD